MNLPGAVSPTDPDLVSTGHRAVAVSPGAEPDGSRRPRRKVLVTTVSSDAHTWNLVFLQKVIEELGCDVVNLGPCVPDDLLVSACLEHRPDLVVVSSVNGHGHQDGLRLIRRVSERSELSHLPFVIGGKLGMDGGEDEDRPAQLLRAGFRGVFEDNPASLSLFRSFLAQLPSGSEL
ncbi:MAG: methylaspartate mutase sigma subunit [Actinomycetota bacterium]|nr:methylaspartate mutase sigma subunit [Actinomycetota bacterium]